MNNPLAVARIKLLHSSQDAKYFADLPFETVDFPTLNGDTSSKTQSPVNGPQWATRGPPTSSQGFVEPAASISPRRVVTEMEAIAKLQATANARTPTPNCGPRPLRGSRTWGPDEKTVLLNINNERVDSELGNIGPDVVESMADRMEDGKFCVSYHLQGVCINLAQGKDCSFRHGPKLSPEETVVLRKFVRATRCEHGSKCRKANCIHGHVCPGEPNCTKGIWCTFRKVHGVDPTAVTIWKR